jgi:hypothetical protein
VLGTGKKEFGIWSGVKGLLGEFKKLFIHR